MCGVLNHVSINPARLTAAQGFLVMAKTFLSFQEQAKLLLSRGMSSRLHSESELLAELESHLQYINYYRLSAYWYPFRRFEKADRGLRRLEDLKPGTNWETVWGYYLFDRRLRNLIFDALSRIEIAIRTRLAYHWAEKYRSTNNPQSNLNCYKSSFLKQRNGKPSPKEKLMEDVNRYYSASHTDCAEHYRTKYGIEDASKLPVWVFMEFTTWGNVKQLVHHGIKNDLQKTLKHAIGFQDTDFFLSALDLLHTARNTCAHQGRVWNLKWKYRQGKQLSDILKNPDRPEWRYVWDADQQQWMKRTNGEALFKEKSSTAALLTLCAVVLKTIAPNSHWQQRVKELFQEAPSTVAYQEVGFVSAAWQQHPFWKTD